MQDRPIHDNNSSTPLCTATQQTKHLDGGCQALANEIELQEILVESMRARQQSRHYMLAVIRNALHAQKGALWEEEEGQGRESAEGCGDTFCHNRGIASLEALEEATEGFFLAMKDLPPFSPSPDSMEMRAKKGDDKVFQVGASEEILIGCSDQEQEEKQILRQEEKEKDVTEGVVDGVTMEDLLGMTEESDHIGVKNRGKRRRKQKKHETKHTEDEAHMDPSFWRSNAINHQNEGKEHDMPSPPGFEHTKTMNLLRDLRKRECAQRNILFKALERFSIGSNDAQRCDAVLLPPALPTASMNSMDGDCPFTEGGNASGENSDKVKPSRIDDLPCWLQPSSEGSSPFFPSTTITSMGDIPLPSSPIASTDVILTTTEVSEKNPSTRLSSSPCVESSLLNKERNSASTGPNIHSDLEQLLDSKETLNALADGEYTYSSDFEEMNSDEEEVEQTKGEIVEKGLES